MQHHQDQEWVKVSARMPRSLLARLARLYPKEKISGILREMIEREITRKKVLKAHLRLYGRFRPEHFDESLL